MHPRTYPLLVLLDTLLGSRELPGTGRRMDPNTISMHDGVDGEPADWVCTMIMLYINCSNVTAVQHDTGGADERRRGVVVVRPELVSNHLKTGSVRC